MKYMWYKLYSVLCWMYSHVIPNQGSQDFVIRFYNSPMCSASLNMADLLPLISASLLPLTSHHSENSWSLLHAAVGYVSRWVE